MTRGKSFLDSSLRLSGIHDILNSTQSPITFSELVKTSKIRYKQSFLKYLRYCNTQELVTKKHTTIASAGRGERRRTTFYSISGKGRKFLEIS